MARRIADDGSRGRNSARHAFRETERSSASSAAGIAPRTGTDTQTDCVGDDAESPTATDGQGDVSCTIVGR